MFNNTLNVTEQTCFFAAGCIDCKNMSSSTAYAERLRPSVAYDSSYFNEFRVCWVEWWRQECHPVDRKVSPYTQQQPNHSPIVMHDV